MRGRMGRDHDPCPPQLLGYQLIIIIKHDICIDSFKLPITLPKKNPQKECLGI